MNATIREIARLAQVHHGTVSIVLNGARGGTRVSEETRQRVIRVAEELGYQPNRAAQQLRTRRSNVVGLLVGDLENPFFARLATLCNAALTDAGFDCVLAMRSHGEVSDMHHLEALQSRQVDGLIVWIESETEIRAWLERKRVERNIVVLGQKISGYDSIDAALATGTREALTHLVEQGYQRIAYLAPESSLMSMTDPRPVVYREFMQAEGLPTMLFPYEGSSHSPESACRCAAQIALLPPRERPDALFCFNDLTAIGALLGVRRGGLEPPHDMGIVGCDGLPLAAQMDVPITSIAYPLEQMCREAVSLLKSRMQANAEPGNDPLPVRHHSFRAPLEVRASSVRIVTTRVPRNRRISLKPSPPRFPS